MKLSSTLLILPVTMILLAGCAQKTTVTPATDESNTQMVAETSDGSTVAPEAAVGDVVQTMNVELSNYEFNPAVISVSAGDTVKITLNAKEGMHDFVVDELAVQSKTLKGGESEEIVIKIPADAKGKSYEFYCSIMNHRSMGMVGKIVVENE